MKKFKSGTNENCIETPTSCQSWNGGDVDFLGVCNGDQLNNLLWEIINKLQEVAGEDISSFELDELLDICNQKKPLETTLISILNLLKANQVCLKDYISTLEETVQALANERAISVNLKCYADFDNLGYALSITRDQLDQLVIDNLCAQKVRIESLEGKVINLQSQIDNINADQTIEELSFPTCINAASLPTSEQVKNTSKELCDLEAALGNASDIAAALSNTPSNWNTKFGGGPSQITGWNLLAVKMMENYSNLLLWAGKMEARMSLIERTCCGPTCDKIEIGIIFEVIGNTLDMTFSSGAGTYIPEGFVDCGSVITFTDEDGNTFTPPLTSTPIIQDGTISGISLSSLAKGTVKVKLNSRFCLQDEADNTILTCNGCFGYEFENNQGCCVITNTGDTQTIIYKTVIN